MSNIFGLEEDQELKDPFFGDSLSSSISSSEADNIINQKFKIPNQKKDNSIEIKKEQMVEKEISKEEEDERNKHPEHFIDLCDSFGFPIKLVKIEKSEENVENEENIINKKRKRSENNNNESNESYKVNIEDKIRNDLIVKDDSPLIVHQNENNDDSSSSSSSGLSEFENNKQKLNNTVNPLNLVETLNNKEEEKDTFQNNVFDINKINDDYGNNSTKSNQIEQTDMLENFDIDKRTEFNEPREVNDDYLDIFDNHEESEPFFNTNIDYNNLTKFNNQLSFPDQYDNLNLFESKEKNDNAEIDFTEKKNHLQNSEDKQIKDNQWGEIDLKSEKNKLNKFLFLRNPKVESHLKGLYENSSSFSSRKDRFQIELMISSLENQNISENKCGFFYFMMLCYRILECSKESNGNLKMSKDIWNKSELNSFLEELKKSNDNILKYNDIFPVRTKEDIDQKIREDDYSKRLLGIFDTYQKEKNVNLLSNYLSNNVIQNIIEEKYKEVNGIRYNLVKTKFYNLYTVFNEERKMFELKVDYLLP